MSHTVEELVVALEQLTLDEHVEDAEQLVDVLRVRAEALAGLENADMDALEPELRAALKARLRAVLERDQELMPRLLARRDELAAALEQIPQGRAAVRGYGEALGEETATTLRRLG